MSARRRSLRDARGMTLIEVLVAATVLLVGISSTFAVVSRGQRLGSDAQRLAQATSLAQAELERIRGTSYAKVGMTGTPAITTAACATAPALPSDWLRSGNPPALQLPASYRSCPATTNPGESLVVCGASGAPTCRAAGAAESATDAVVAPTPSDHTFPDGTAAKVYRYVSWRPSTACTAASSGCTAAPEASKRVTVAVVLTPVAGGGVTRPIWTSTVLTPEAGPR